MAEPLEGVPEAVVKPPMQALVEYFPPLVRPPVGHVRGIAGMVHLVAYRGGRS